jgi:hypothetical protein
MCRHGTVTENGPTERRRRVRVLVRRAQVPSRQIPAQFRDSGPKKLDLITPRLSPVGCGFESHGAYLRRVEGRTLATGARTGLDPPKSKRMRITYVPTKPDGVPDPVQGGGDVTDIKKL